VQAISFAQPCENGHLVAKRKSTSVKLLIVTDSHLAPSAHECNANWHAIREYAARSSAQLTVHLGDMTLDAVSDETQLESARAVCDGRPTSFRFIPGNHDIGDNPAGPDSSSQHPVEPRLMGSFRRIFGPDYWSMAAGNWFLIALNAQLFGERSRVRGRAVAMARGISL
jgi:3',5'-cyclic AMP phosphodiesterase CpdA